MRSERGRWKIWLLAALIAAPLVACGLSTCGDAPSKQPQHVVLIVVDTLRADHLSTYGYRRPTSPELDKLAAQGVVFENAVSQCSWTQPSMVSMMTGAYLADELRAIPPDKETLAQAFKKGEYATAAFIYNNVLDPEHGFQAGFDVFDYQDPPYGSNEKIINWINANKGKKTFTFIHLNEAHDPYDPPPAFDRFVNEVDSISKERLAWYRETSKRLELADHDENVREINRQIGGYDDDVRYSDDHIGKILAAIRAGGEWDRTAVVIAADHGEGLWTREQFMTGPRLREKLEGKPPRLFTTLHDHHGNGVNLELVHVPLILVAPGMPAGVRVQPWVENVDIGATILELCDLPRPPSMQGQSLLPLWTQPEVVAHQKRGSFSHTRYVSTFIDQNGYQLIKPTARGECDFNLEIELYNLNVDPDARVNLAASEKARVNGMLADIEARVKMGLVVADLNLATSDESDKLAALGYIGAELVDLIDKKYAAMSESQLLEALAYTKNPDCFERRRAAMALNGRTLNEEQILALRALREKEPSTAVKDVYDKVLAK